MDGNQEKSIKVLGLPKVCPNMKGQNLAIFIQSHEFAKDLQLADEISPCPLALKK